MGWLVRSAERRQLIVVYQLGFRTLNERKIFLNDMASKLKPQRDNGREVLRHLGERVRNCRHSRGLTQEALAEALDLSVAYVSLIERGGRNPPYTTVVSIAQALGVRVAELCPDD